MFDLSARALRSAFDHTQRLLEIECLPDVPEQLLPGLAKLTRSDSAAYHVVDLRSSEEIAVGWPHDVFRPASLAAYSALMPQHPLIARFTTPTLPETPVRISDVLSFREWSESALYKESHAALGVDDQMAVLIARTGTTVRALSMSRSGRAYSDEDREVLRLVTPHLRAALRRAHGSMTTTPALRVAPRVEYVRLGAGESEPPAELIDRLTSRECEVAQLVAAGLTNDQVARRLGISAGTVRKHLEHIYAKLGLDNRVGVAHLLLPTNHALRCATDTPGLPPSRRYGG